MDASRRGLLDEGARKGRRVPARSGRPPPGPGGSAGGARYAGEGVCRSGAAGARAGGAGRAGPHLCCWAGGGELAGGGGLTGTPEQLRRPAPRAPPRRRGPRLLPRFAAPGAGAEPPPQLQGHPGWVTPPPPPPLPDPTGRMEPPEGASPGAKRSVSLMAKAASSAPPPHSFDTGQDTRIYRIKTRPLPKRDKTNKTNRHTEFKSSRLLHSPGSATPSAVAGLLFHRC
nr:dysbindin domain-containing protein 1 isoform X6 [Camelus dromedarius]